ncbi:MAG: NUDIX domain-containing protein [Bacteriovorax sp.]|nr:NUDIX domain-containing protein [Bacteriovorax sp.]
MKKNLIVSIAIFVNDIEAEGFKVWVQVREEKGALYGKLEFPGGKIEVGETPEEACRREVHEEVGFVIPPAEKLVLFKYQDYSVENKNICLFVFISKFNQLPQDKGQWLTISYTGKSAFLEGKIPPINHVIIDELAVYIKKQFDAGLALTIWQP